MPAGASFHDMLLGQKDGESIGDFDAGTLEALNMQRNAWRILNTLAGALNPVIIESERIGLAREHRCASSFHARTSCA
jgi:hypothetical protein